ncbi:hypothetical protein MTR_4g106460 [Medicago truncatula]|uniref:Uncharacterized protein n=1 Tax=Medicago truncatula TaxID=3880 RepID=G7JNR7_MEDTR|nr:hypothetical protein MTR_4g106460 [Medicago truncatula]
MEGFIEVETRFKVVVIESGGGGVDDGGVLEEGIENGLMKVYVDVIEDDEEMKGKRIKELKLKIY